MSANRLSGIGFFPVEAEAVRQWLFERALTAVVASDLTFAHSEHHDFKVVARLGLSAFAIV
jgi:hypothetical protein